MYIDCSRISMRYGSRFFFSFFHRRRCRHFPSVRRRFPVRKISRTNDCGKWKCAVRRKRVEDRKKKRKKNHNKKGIIYTRSTATAATNGTYYIVRRTSETIWRSGRVVRRLKKKKKLLKLFVTRRRPPPTPRFDGSNNRVPMYLSILSTCIKIRLKFIPT